MPLFLSDGEVISYSFEPKSAEEVDKSLPDIYRIPDKCW